MRLNQTPYSYRDDLAVPDFPDDGPIAVMDAYCALCAKGAQWIARNDTRAEFRIIPLQSSLGHALMQHYGLDPADPSSWLYLQDGRAYSSLDATIRVGGRLGGKWKTLSLLNLLPTTLQDWLYARVARIRYKILGRADLCSLPDPAVLQRLLT